ncbi:MAG: ABC transporter ATP-binding protein, partial [Aurantimonas sp.]|nr:ABC transporter ATP-binding protein [Aurantimonas sp.]
VATRIAVMKDGRVIADREAGHFTRQSLVSAMGHVASEKAAQRVRPQGDDILSTPEGLKARRGEIVGLAGLAGHGQAEALAAFYLSQTSNWRARAPQAVFVAGDRGRDGIFPLWSILRNATLAALPRLTRRGMVDRDGERTLAEDWREKIGIRTDDIDNPILSLSGGNQQKVLFARALATEAPIVIMDDPMRGVDIGTKTQVYEMIRREADVGRTFLWYSTEIDETCLCDRVFVYRNGSIAAELTGAAITEEQILSNSFEMQGQAA